MAFTDQDLTKYFTTGFKNVPSTIEGMEEFANGILSYEGKFSPGNSAFYGWAKTALSAIKEYKEIASGKSKQYGSLEQEKASNRTGNPIGQYLLNQASKWLTGNAQPSKAKRVLEKYEDSKADINKKLQNELSNIANIMDFPEGMSEEEKAKLTAKADKIKAELQGTLEDAPLFGVSVNPDLVRTSGGFIPKDEATQAQKTVNSRVGEPTIIDQNTFEIKGVNTGKVYDVGTNLQEALAKQQAITGGASPNVGGRPDLLATEPTAAQTVEPFVDLETGQTITPRVATPEELTQNDQRTLPSYNQVRGIDAPPDAITGSEEAGASNDLTIAIESSVGNKESEATIADPNLVVTPEMRAEWVQESLDELRNNRYYQEVIRNTEFDLGTSLNRLVEDTRLRELGVAEQYKQNLQSTQRNLQSQGMLYGGVRQGQETDLANRTNLGLTELGTSLNRGIQDIGQSGERYFGSDYFSTIAPKFGNTQQVGRVIIGSPVYQPGKNIQLATTQGGQYGSLTRDINTEAQFRAGERETAFRDITSQYA